jgi:hypothetical protein
MSDYQVIKQLHHELKELADETRRLRLTDEEREVLLFCYRAALPEAEKLGGNAGELCRIHRDTLRGLLERLG